VKLPTLPFLRDQAAVREFERQDPTHRQLVFYSEGAHDWPHIGPVVTELLTTRSRPFSYLASDPADPGLAIDDDRLKRFPIGAGTAGTVLFARIKAGVFAMTLPDLGNLWLKRSVHPVHYAYLFHSFNSTHTSYRTGAFDQFDSVLCVGPHHVDEIRRTEEVYGLPRKELVEHGSSKLDMLLGEIGAVEAPSARAARVLIAPTWGEHSILESGLGPPLLEVLSAAGLDAVVRPHPMTSRRLPGLLAKIATGPAVHVEQDMSATESWLRSDLMISDWSGAATEYAFATGKPVVYIETPPKIMNAEWERIGLPSFEDRIRGELGAVVSPTELERLPEVIGDLLAGGAATRDRISAARERSTFNLGASSTAAARFLDAASAGA
jgi:YidC/Oxa1 family membrane protein insertase